MRPATRNLEIYGGQAYLHYLTITDNAEPPAPLSLAGYTFLAQVRKNRHADAVAAATFTVVVDDASEGRLHLSLTAAQVDALPSVGVWDLQATVGGVATTWLTGDVRVTRDVSRA